MKVPNVPLQLQPPKRHSLGSAGTNATAGGPPQVEESFNLLPNEDAMLVCMTIKLAPDLVEEIKRVEADGGKARMKFDSNPKNSNGNIIEVGGKEFRFMWSPEFGDLCDIYEERQSGEDGNGLLVEFGYAWRKVNVQRILDESTKNHVKMRSEEAERNQKSRKAIVLEPGNPSMKSQIKAIAAIEATPWKNYSKKKEGALRKRKVEAIRVEVEGPSKSTHKRVSSKNATESSPQDQPTASSTPLGAANISSRKIDGASASQIIEKHDTNAGYEKGIPTRTNMAMRDTTRGKGNSIDKPIDLQSTLISLLMNKPNGLTLKAMEKVVQDMVPDSLKKIKPILRKIAKYKSPGRYILLPGVDLESLKKPQIESGSSPDDNHGQISVHHELNDHLVSQGDLSEKVSHDDLKKLVQINSNVEEESNACEKINFQRASPYFFGGEKAPDHSKWLGGGTSDGGSDDDNEIDNGDSDSDTKSHSKSSARTGSGSSSDSESDASFNSKEGLDEDVNIVTSDEEKESKHKTGGGKATENASSQYDYEGFHKWQMNIKRMLDERENGVKDVSRHGQSDNPGILSRGKRKRDSNVKNVDVTVSNKGRKTTENMSSRFDYEGLQEWQMNIRRMLDERENGVKDSFMHGQSDNPEILSKGKCKRDSNKEKVDTTVSNKGGKATINMPLRLEHEELREWSMNIMRMIDERKNGGKDGKQTPNSLEEVADGGKDTRADKNNGGQKRESSSVEDHCPFSKFEKDEPELKGPIRTLSQYREYVEDFRDKYDYYIASNMIIKSFRSRFCQLGRSLDYFAKDDRDIDMYYEILRQVKEICERHLPKHKRMKKIFTILHAEVKQLKKMILDFMDSRKTQ